MTDYYEPITYQVTELEEGWLVKTVLQRRLGVSRKLLSRIKLTERGVMLNGERVYISVPVRAGDIVSISLEQEMSEDILPQPIPFDIVYEDNALLIVNKEPGIIVHPTHGHYMNTLANGVVHYWQAKGEKYRFRPVHRLDQETSGIIAIAKNAYIHQHISEQLIAGQVSKKYIALVHGCPQPASASIDGPIDRDPQEPHRRIVTADGYPALTHYEVKACYGEGALVELRLETGRTHQIRVHMTSIGHPLIGDKMYRYLGFDKLNEQERTSMNALDALIDRQALHAAELGFIHPLTGEQMVFSAPLPADMAHLQKRLNNGGSIL
ncbi:RluA family pseudouridine synthase [Paenibacillus motobuensis]|uniref:RluA family pseudouridine synthase n=1 Tax=Paenibacillus TaxID=44249 RepID=UPI00203AEE83|nr:MULTISPECIES: RluA family pseudouridine synthase [Paenibacillus]MCM3038861.1 RluA family pseudouridine synthase [Paenibacillus lutimineralis]MCM3645965.1 RluA family pseudouridine synthase [Paenibacillus motobuensis]